MNGDSEPAQEECSVNIVRGSLKSAVLVGGKAVSGNRPSGRERGLTPGGLGVVGIAVLALLAPAFAQAASDMYCSERDVQAVDGAIQLARRWEVLFEEGFEHGLDRWRTENYEGKLVIGLGEQGDTGDCVLVTNQGAKGDTAFEIASPPIPVTAGAIFRFGLSWRANRSLAQVSGHKGHYLTQLQWLDEAGEALDATPFSFGKASKEWQTKRVEGTVPEEAVNLVIRFGFDHPNLSDKEFLALDNLSVQARAEPALHEHSGTMLSRPLRVAGDERRLSWEAEVPAGTAVRVQVASAPDEDGDPGEWSAALGAEGTDQGFFTEAGPLPPAHRGHLWIRYLVTLETEDPSATPVLRTVSIGEVKDGPWVGLDAEPPAVAERSPTRTADAELPISFRLADATGIDRRSLRVRLDGEDITAQLTSREDRYVYQPPEALIPPPAEKALLRWRVKNYRGALIIERNARREPDSPLGFHITREAGQADTAFCIQSPPLPVEPGGTYQLSYWSRHSVGLSSAMNGEGSFSGGVTWFGEGDIAVGERAAIDFGEADTQWHRDAYELTAPAGATSTQIAFGFDTPNIFDGGFVDIAELVFEGPRPERTDGSPNLHRVRVEVRDFAGNALSRTWYILIRPPRAENIVTVRDDGTVLIDGEPFFPIGLYAVWKKEFNDNSFDKAFGDLKAAGFNLAHTYSSARGADFAEFYAAAQRHGIKLYVASDAGANCMDVDTVLWDVAREEGQPTLLAWYLADDTASHVGHEELRTVSEAIGDIDPAHITVQADGVGGPPVSRYADYVNSTDGFLPELYPIRDDSDQGVPRIIADMKTIQADLESAGTRQRTIWAIVQYFQGWGWPRYPTKEELWAMSYLSIIHGANGITWYTYGGSGDNHGVTAYPQQWQNISELAGELSQLEEVLVERTGPQPPAPDILTGPGNDALGYPSISVLLKEHAGKTYLLAANSARAEVAARFPVAAGKAVSLPFEDRQLLADETGFEDVFGPYGVHVYVW